MARALIVLAVILGLGGSVRAEDTATAAAIEAQVARGKHLFDEQEYRAAIQTLFPVARDVRATRTQRLHALEVIALAQYIMGDASAARGTFERILDIDPGYTLRDTSGSPKIRAFFEDLKKQLVPARPTIRSRCRSPPAPRPPPPPARAPGTRAGTSSPAGPPSSPPAPPARSSTPAAALPRARCRPARSPSRRSGWRC